MEELRLGVVESQFAEISPDAVSPSDSRKLL